MKKTHSAALRSVSAVLLTTSIFAASALAAQPSKMTVELAKVMPVSAQPTTASAVGALFPNVIVNGHHLVTSQFHKYSGNETYTEWDGSKTPVDGTFDDVSLAHYSFKTSVVDASGTIVRGTLDYGAFDFDMMSKKKGWLTEQTYPAREVKWTCAKYDSQGKCTEYEFSNIQNNQPNPYHVSAPAEVPALGCKYENTPDEGLPLPSNPTDYERTVAETFQGNVYIPAFEAYVQHKDADFEYSLVTGLLKVTVGNAVHEWKIAEKFTDRWEMTQNIYKSGNPLSREVDGRLWGGEDNTKPRAFGYMSESLNPVPHGSAKLRDHFYYTEPATSVGTSKGYYGSSWSNDGIPDREDVGTNVQLNESTWSLAPYSYLETDGVPYADNVYGKASQSGCAPLGNATWCDSFVALNVLRPKSDQYTSLLDYPGLDDIENINYRWDLPQNGLEILDEQLPDVPTQADGQEIPNFSSLIYRSGGHVNDPRLTETDKNGTVIPSTCRTRWNSFRRGHAHMMFGAWKDGKFANFVGVEQVFQGKGYPYMSVTHTANSEWSTKFAENTLRDMTGTVDSAAVTQLVKYIDQLDDRSGSIYVTMANAKFKARMGIGRLYNAMLKRGADTGGLLYWISQLESGTGIDQIAEGFSHSGEFNAIYGHLNNNDFVLAAYRNALGREADAGGLAFFKGQLDTGAMTRARVLVIMTESAEGVARFVYRDQIEMLHQLLAGRAPTAAELMEWEPRLVAAAPDAATLRAETSAMIDLIVASDEYIARF